MTPIQNPQEDISSEAITWILATPKALAFLICSYLSGQLWVFIIYGYLRSSRKGHKDIDNWRAKTALGALWFVPFLITVYLYKFGIQPLNEVRILASVLETILIGAFAQLIVIIIIIATEKK